jgi:hypothetical protein
LLAKLEASFGLTHCVEERTALRVGGEKV